MLNCLTVPANPELIRDPSAYGASTIFVDRREAITCLVRPAESGPLMQALKVRWLLGLRVATTALMVS